jgi:hemoglobin
MTLNIDQSTQDTIYNQIGGEKAIDTAVDMFYDKVLSDPDLMHFFDETNMAFQRKHQKDFITYLTGGTKVWKGKDMRAAHKNLKLTDEHFDAIKNYLTQTLSELGVAENLVDKIGIAIEGLRNDILNR